MNPTLLPMTTALLSAFLLLACSSNGEGHGPSGKSSKAESRPSKKQEEPPFATMLVVKKKPDSLPKIDVEVMESFPQQFALTFSLQTPSPGYEAKVGQPKAKGKALQVRVDLTPPDGPSLTVLDKAKVRIPLGELHTGAWTLQVQVFEDNKLHSTLNFALEAR